MIRLGVLFGGKSSEHEISVLSAASMMDAVDRSKYEVLPIGINKAGEWFHITADMRELVKLDDERFQRLIPEKGQESPEARRIDVGEFDSMVDFAFPILHGPFGEDGTIQGLFEMLGKPYAGCGVTCSALSMDKIFTKEIWANAGLPVCKYVYTTEFEFKADREGQLDRIEKTLAYPVYVKPANMGSSVGISKVSDRAGLESAIELAKVHDSRILIEEEVNGRELEIAILGSNQPISGAVGEIVTVGGFYDYDSKYKDDNSTKLIIPADIPEEIENKIRRLACSAYRTLGGDGFSRIDFFWDEKADVVYLNEMNTIPGFTAYSMFPLLLKAKGIPYQEIIERIIELGYERYNSKNNRESD